MKKTKEILIKLFYISIIILLLGVLFLLSFFIYFAKDLPRPERYTDHPISEPTKIYDRTGEHVLYNIYGEEKREIISIDNVPDHFIDALLVSEDANFYNHFGVDLKGILRSVILNIRGGRTVAGGSTISQQFVRSAFLTTERELVRKVREIILTLELERRYSKEEILEFYLNQIPFGSNAYGIESASQTFFNKSVNDLTLAESATIVSMLPAPSYLSPYGNNLEELLRRKNNLLNRMYNANLITEEELNKAKEEDIIFHRSGDLLRAPHFVLRVKSDLERMYGEDFLKEEGLEVYTTIDFEIQQKAEQIIKNNINRLSSFNAHNAGIVVFDPNTGEILAMVGSADYFKDPLPQGCIPGSTCRFEPYTNVTLSNRQPGSVFKPFIYATAFEKGYNGEDIVMDELTNFGTESNPYIPRNYDGQFRGEVSLRDSLAQSLNIPSIKVLRDFAGLHNSVEKAKLFGINLPYSAEFYGLPLVLGGGDVKLLEVVSAYGVFSTEGYKNTPYYISKIKDNNNQIILENNSNPQYVLQPSVAREITDILSDNEARSPVFGTNSVLHFPDNKVAVKTGSTQSFRDAWTVGYNSSFVVGVWVGNNDNTSMYNAPGLSVAGPIWKEMMDYLIKEY